MCFIINSAEIGVAVYRSETLNPFFFIGMLYYTYYIQRIIRITKKVAYISINYKKLYKIMDYKRL